MPRPARISVADGCYHVLNRGNGRNEDFHKPEDYEAFLRLIADACQRLAMRVLGYCIMPNHFHLALQPRHDGDLSRWMQWLSTAHVRRYHRHYHGQCQRRGDGLLFRGAVVVVALLRAPACVGDEAADLVFVELVGGAGGADDVFLHHDRAHIVGAEE